MKTILGNNLKVCPHIWLCTYFHKCKISTQPVVVNSNLKTCKALSYAEKMDLALFQLASSYHWHGPNIKVLFKRSLTLLAGADEAVRIICSGFVFALLRRNFNMLSNILNAADFNLLALMLFCFHKRIIRFVFSFPVRLFMFLNGQSPASFSFLLLLFKQFYRIT